MPAFQRFDLDGTANHIVITDREMKRRWASFHGDMRAMSGNLLQRTLGWILGEDTIRYKSARLFGRPLLRTVRRMRSLPQKTEPVPAPSSFATTASTIFPANYKPKFAQMYVNRASSVPKVDDVAVVVVNEAASSPTAVIDSLNETLDATTSTWLLLIDATCTASQRITTVTALLGRATPEDDVVFADETGPNEFTPIFKSPSVGPHTLLSYNLVGRPALLRVSTLQRVGGFCADAGWAFEHDAYLRLSESGATFRHVSLVLPAGRPELAFSASHINDATCRVVQAALDRRGWSGQVVPGALDGVVRWILEPPSPSPRSTSSSRRATASTSYASASRRSRRRRRTRTTTSSSLTTTRSCPRRSSTSRPRSTEWCRAPDPSTTRTS